VPPDLVDEPISYNTPDEVFARRLHARLQQEHVRVWFATEDLKGGFKLQEQIDRAIEIHDRLLLVLSEASLTSDWVAREIRRARAQEERQSRRKLFPIRLVPFESLRRWERFDVDTTTDIGRELREYFIPDFSNWRDTKRSRGHSRSSFETCARRTRHEPNDAR
jgi:hypothetical protein